MSLVRTIWGNDLLLINICMSNYPVLLKVKVELKCALLAVNCFFSLSREEHYILHGYLEPESITVALILEHNIGRQVASLLLFLSSDLTRKLL